MRTKAAILAIILALAGCGAAFFWPFGRKTSSLVLPGVVEIQEVRLGPRIAGRVIEIFTTEGDLVRAGQILVRMEAPELEAQRDQSRARLREAEQQLEKAKNGARKEEKEASKAWLESAQAKLRRLEAGFRTEEIRQAKSELDSAEAMYRLASEDFERADRTFRTGATPRAELDSARANLDNIRGRVANARAKLDLLQAGTRPEEVDEARADVRRYDANLRLLLAGTRPEEIAEAEARVAELQARIREIEVNLKEREVTAPEPAVVEVLAVRKGDLVSANQPVIRVLRAADMWVKVFVPETDLGKVSINQKVEVTVDSYPGRRFSGRVVQINHESEFTPRNIQSVDERHHQVFGVRVRIDDSQGVFKSGMAAEVIVPLD